MSSRKKEIDFAVLLSHEPKFFNYAGIVIETLGYTRWQNFSQIEDVSSAIWVTELENLNLLRAVSQNPVIVEMTTGQNTIQLPCSLKITPELESFCKDCVGLYKHLDNYNGIEGINDDYLASVPFWITRSRSQKKSLLDVNINFSVDSPLLGFECQGTPLVTTPDGTTLISKEDNIIYLGLPLISLLASHLTVPPFPETQYRFSEPIHHLFKLLEGLIEQIAIPGILKVSPWPNNEQGVFSVRHDLDRSTDIVNLCHTESQYNIKPTLHILADNIPGQDELQEILKIGGEIGLHSRYLHLTASDIATIEKLTEKPIQGNSAHGGAYSDGWQGYYNLLAAHQQGLLYTELLSEMNILPHRIPDLENTGKALYPIAMPHHISFDVNKNTDDSERVIPEIDNIFKNYGHLTIMNHPDINFKNFIEFITKHIPKTIRCLTLAETAHWWKSTHTQNCFNIELFLTDNSMEIQGQAKPSQIGAVLNIRLPHELVETQLEYKNISEVQVKLIYNQPYLSFRLSNDSVNRYSISLHKV